ncbi:hypothetical protein EMEDMD4_500110 [Sinorhizobium medicae]|uniref:Uncharacterized protein n=1 Tax=Sinorhizobium medicae TaxID=110321 RepID=A0A508X1C2_9HYPH|nr:hypothetical protein EMEDMD4_500110 [Sinorhizobium medicae]
MSYASVDFDNFTDPFAARVSLDDGDSLRLDRHEHRL